MNVEHQESSIANQARIEELERIMAEARNDEQRALSFGGRYRSLNAQSARARYARALDELTELRAGRPLPAQSPALTGLPRNTRVR